MSDRYSLCLSKILVGTIVLGERYSCTHLSNIQMYSTYLGPQNLKSPNICKQFVTEQEIRGREIYKAFHRISLIM